MTQEKKEKPLLGLWKREINHEEYEEYDGMCWECWDD